MLLSFNPIFRNEFRFPSLHITDKYHDSFIHPKGMVVLSIQVFINISIKTQNQTCSKLSILASFVVSISLPDIDLVSKRNVPVNIHATNSTFFDARNTGTVVVLLFTSLIISTNTGHALHSVYQPYRTLLRSLYKPG